MNHVADIATILTVILSAFVIGWAAETAQVYLSRALALSVLAWLQTSPEFAVEATIAWNQQRDLMIANLTGSLRLLLGLGWPMVFGVYFTSTYFREKRFVKRIVLSKDDSLTVLFLFISILYFFVIWGKASLVWYDSVVLTGIYVAYLLLTMRLPPGLDEDDEHDLPWIGKKIVALESRFARNASILALFAVGGIALYFSAHPFVDALQRWSVSLGISTFVFVQWVAPFLSEFPEKVTAFQWALQQKKAPLAVMNFVNSNLNQWTLLAAMLPIIFGISLGRFDGIHFSEFQEHEILLTLAQALVGALLILDLEFSVLDAALIFILWVAQFISADLRHTITNIYFVWAGIEVVRIVVRRVTQKRSPLTLVAFREMIPQLKAGPKVDLSRVGRG